MRISKLVLTDFRGWEHLDLRPGGHVLLAGVPRAGRSDVIAAICRVLDPESARVHPVLADLRQYVRGADVTDPAEESTGEVRRPADEANHDDPVTDSRDGPGVPARVSHAEVELTLVDLDEQTEQDCDGFLEPQDLDGQASEEVEADPSSSLCARIAYRVSYDPVADALEHVVYFPTRSSPQIGQFQRVPMAVRRRLPVVVIGEGRPLQLRAEGTLRRLLMDRDPDGTAEALARLRDAVNLATRGLSSEAVITHVVDAVLSAGGASRRLTDDDVDASSVQFQAEDGSLAALLRAVQPALDLDSSGLLPLTNHGSTAAAVLSAAEALLVSQIPGAIVLVDDFGDRLDGATAEHLASMLRADAGQLWMSTRRPEVARAFEPHEVTRLTRHGGLRAVHTIARPADRKELAVQRVLQTQLLPALTSSTVAITEGPHDVTVYSLADRRRAPSSLPLSAYGIRLVSADNGSGGGLGQVARVARLARQLGFRVLALIDGDGKGDGETVTAIEQECDVVIRLPPGVAVEAAIVRGIDPQVLRSAAATLTEWGIPDPTIDVDDAEVADALVRPLHNHGLHEPLLEALIPDTGIPPVLGAALDALRDAADPTLESPRLVVLDVDREATGPAGAR